MSAQKGKGPAGPGQGRDERLRRRRRPACPPDRLQRRDRGRHQRRFRRRWRELLDGAGVRRAAISGPACYRDEASDARLRQMFFDGTIDRFQIVVPAFGTIEGLFQISSLDIAATMRAR